MRKTMLPLAVLAMAMAGAGAAKAQTTLFFDDFSGPESEEAYDVVEFKPAEAEAGIRHEYAFGPNPDTFFDGDYGFFGLPPAPRTEDESTLGLWTYVNMLGGEADGLNFYTKESYAGNLRVTVDVFMRWGGSGSTEYMGLGLFHSGDVFNNFEQALDGSDVLGAGGDGYVFWMNTDGDCADCDYLFTKYMPGVSIQPGDSDADPPDPYFTECGTWNFEDPEELPGLSTTCLIDAVDSPLFTGIYPEEGRLGHASGSVAGSPANDWTTVTIEYIDGGFSIYLDGTLVHTYMDSERTYTSGKVMLAWEDPFNSLGVEQMGWFDNLLIEQLDSETDVKNWQILP